MNNTGFLESRIASAAIFAVQNANLLLGEFLKRKYHRVRAQALHPLEVPHKTGNFVFKKSP